MDNIAGFANGTHVVIDRGEDDKVAGNLLGETEDGYVVRVTHRMVHKKPILSEETYEALREEMETWPLWRLKVMGVFNGIREVGKKDRYALVDEGVRKVAAGIVARLEEVEVFEELLLPVKTFLPRMSVWTMEASQDVNNNAVLGNLDASLA